MALSLTTLEIVWVWQSICTSIPDIVLIHHQFPFSASLRA
ncbi:uncharacterized protein METZ01_LOCUS231297, partial [marine metagenome]